MEGSMSPHPPLEKNIDEEAPTYPKVEDKKIIEEELVERIPIYFLSKKGNKENESLL